MKDNISPNMHVRFRLNGPLLFPDFTKLGYGDKVLVKMVSLKFHENKLFAADTRTDRQTYDEAKIHCSQF